ncbi:hypothetical protein R5R35_004203 [Gryllus longicercus]|uniref:RING-type domain-containing protein n=1 Tax=Gryllus longicercus TaxID=2509291 RepID=A0AAN9V954_9ORTH
MAAQPPSFNLKSEADRYKTFERWPVPFMDAHKLAAAGFYYINRDDLVKCVFCGVEVGNWEEGDDPFQDHQRWQPSCPFIRKMPVGNIPLSGNVDTPPGREVSRGYDVCGPYTLEIRPHSARENAGNSSETPLEMLGINQARAPAWTMYATSETRLKSFSSWPVSIKQRPEKLSEAGFFYTGKSDKTVCFHCGGGLKDWEETDDPWVEHAKWFPKCSYVVLNKGKEFVASVAGEEGSRPTSKEVKNFRVPAELKESVQIREPVEPSTSSSESEPIASTSSGSQGGDDVRLCKICYQEDLGVVFLPCGHLVACVKCAPSLTTCAVCRQPFTATVRAFLS